MADLNPESAQLRVLKIPRQPSQSYLQRVHSACLAMSNRQALVVVGRRREAEVAGALIDAP